MPDDAYREQVLRIVEQVPPGRVTTYGLIAEAVGRGGPRQVASVMARDGAAVPWWRVVRSDGSLPDRLLDEARQAWLEEGTVLRGSGLVDVPAGVWLPPEPVEQELSPLDDGLAP